MAKDLQKEVERLRGELAERDGDQKQKEKNRHTIHLYCSSLMVGETHKHLRRCALALDFCNRPPTQVRATPPSLIAPWSDRLGNEGRGTRRPTAAGEIQVSD